MREDRGFYGSVEDVARETRIVEGTEEDRASQLRAMGARDLADLMELVATGDIRFAKNAVIFFAGCGVAGKRSIEPGSIAARAAEIADAIVFASIDVTDQSMGRGPSFRDREYSRADLGALRCPVEPPERLNTRVIDALKQLNFGERGGGGAIGAGRRIELASLAQMRLAADVRCCNRQKRTSFERPLWAMCGRLRVGKSFLHVCSIGRCSHVFGLWMRFT